MAGNAHARAADPGAAISLDETFAAENSASLTNGQGAAKRRCPGCARKCTKFARVWGWHDGRATLLCKRCAGGLIMLRGHVAGLKLAPEVKDTLGARP
jgi:hypothetical protein